MLTFLNWTKPGDLQSNFFLEIGDYLTEKHFQAVFMFHNVKPGLRGQFPYRQIAIFDVHLAIL